MPVFMDQPDAFERICQVENEIDEKYAEHVEEDKWHPCSFFAFKKVWDQKKVALAEFASSNPSLAEQIKNTTIDVEGNGAIYGALGYNRYAVMCNGEICFIRDLAINPSFIAKAQAAGFRVF